MHRLFHHHAVAGLDKERDDKIERLIRLRKDLDLARRGLHALGAKKRCQLLAQEAVALVGAEKILARAAAGQKAGNVVRDALR